MVEGQVRLLLTAVQFMTRLPVPGWVGHGPGQLDRAARYFPAVGVLVGGVGAAVLTVARGGLPPLVAAGLAVGAMVVVTGALHEDGLADTVDGLLGGWTREDALRIMKDSRIGAFGAAALVLVLGLKAVVVAGLPPLALVASGAASRLAAVCVMVVLPYARLGQAEARSAAVAAGRGGVAVAGVCGLLPLVLLGWRGVVGLLLAAGLAAGLAAWFRRRLGGYTGDCLGAVQQASELGILLAALWRAG